MPLPWLGPAALLAMNALQLWLQGEQVVNETELRGLVGELVKGAGQGGTGQGAPIGSGEWIEEQEWLETERAASGGHHHHHHCEDD